MYDFKKILNRAEMQQVAAFLLYGACNDELDVRSPESRMKDAEQKMTLELQNLIPPELFEDVVGVVYHYASVTEDIYMELGIACGMRLAQKNG